MGFQVDGVIFELTERVVSICSIIWSRTIYIESTIKFK